MSGHALLSASSSHRWLHCTASPRLEEKFKKTTSVAAEEGTAAHNLCEFKLNKALGTKQKRPTSSFDCDEMEEHTDDYVRFIIEQFEEAKQHCNDPIILIEQKLNFSTYVPDGFGTADCIIVTNEKLHVIDFKYGKGVLVDASENSQMMLYAIGSLLLYDSLYNIEEISMTIFQPRRENVSTWTISANELKEWAEKTLKPIAKIAYSNEGEFLFGQWCGFCSASTKCRKRAEENLKIAEYEFKMPPLLLDKEIEEILVLLPDLVKWANDITAFATNAAIYHGKEWDGFKVVEGRSNRKYKDENLVAKIAIENGYKDIYRQSLIPLTEMEKLMGINKFKEIVGEFIIKPLGKPTLVANSDKRKPINVTDVTDEFNIIMEDKKYE